MFGRTQCIVSTPRDYYYMHFVEWQRPQNTSELHTYKMHTSMAGAHIKSKEASFNGSNKQKKKQNGSKIVHGGHDFIAFK
jgi:hypothetical protein